MADNFRRYFILRTLNKYLLSFFQDTVLSTIIFLFDMLIILLFVVVMPISTRHLSDRYLCMYQSNSLFDYYFFLLGSRLTNHFNVLAIFLPLGSWISYSKC